MPHHHITKEEIKKALRKTKVKNAVSLYSVHVKIWKCLGEKGLE